MEQDKFELNKSNKILLLIAIVLIILNAIMGIFTAVSFNKKIEGLPDLETTLGKTSTKYAPGSTTYTTTTTTTKAIRDKSPYYDYDVDLLVNTELISKNKLTMDEAKELINKYNIFLDNFFNIKNNDIFDIESTIKGAKSNEIDKITDNVHNYGIIYNHDKILEKYFNHNFKNAFLNIKYNDSNIFILNDNSLYRIEDILGNKYPVYESEEKRVYITKSSETELEARIYYYLANYQEEGKRTPVTEYTTIKLRFNKNWKVSEYTFPSYQR